MTKVLVNDDVASLYPNIVRVYGFSSRSQADKDGYVNILEMRMNAKHNKLPQDFLDNLGVSNKDVKNGLKLIINAYTGALRASFNDVADPQQGVNICLTGQLLLLQLGHDLKQIPTFELTRSNTDAIEGFVDEKYLEQVHDVIHKWEKDTGLEMEEDNIVKVVARDINNYCEIRQVGDNNYEVTYKGGCFTGIHHFDWNKEKRKFEYKFEDSLTSNSLTICAEAMLKYLLFAIPVEKTIEKCNDILRFQNITHLGGTFEKCLLVYPNGEEIELQRNNRIYAGKEKTNGKIYKVKPNGQRCIVPLCPKNPIVDNKNEITIDKIDKSWYVKYTNQKISDFLGRKDVYMEEKLDKLKKDELVELVKKLQTTPLYDEDKHEGEAHLLAKIANFRKEIRERNFILDKELPTNLGGGEIYSIDQIYSAVQDAAMNNGLDFSFDVVDILRYDIGAFKPANGAPQNIATIKCVATLTDIDTGCFKDYEIISQGSDSIDKAINGATTYGFRNWFTKNFTPNKINGETLDKRLNLDLDVTPQEEPKSVPKTKAFIPKEVKEKVVEEIVSTPQKSEDDTTDIDELTSLIYKYREVSGDDTAGKNKLDAIIKGNYTDLDIESWKQSFQIALDNITNAQ